MTDDIFGVFDMNDFKTAWHNCPHCKKMVLVVVNDKSNELKFYTEEEYYKEE